MIVAQNRPAHHRKAVVMCCDANVVDFADFIALQILKAEPDLDFDICVATFDPTLKDKKMAAPGIRICVADLKPFNKLPTDGRIPITSYLRLGLPEMFASQYDRVVYLDTDIFLRGKISDLFEAAPVGIPISGVVDLMHWFGLGSKRMTRYCTIIGVYPNRYMNAGIMVMDINACNAENLSARFLEHAAKVQVWMAQHPDVAFAHDQTAINATLKGSWYPLSLRWNWPTVRFSAHLIDHMKPHILHFVGNSKPWMGNPRPYAKKYLGEHLAEIETVFTDMLHAKLPRQVQKPLHKKEKLSAAVINNSLRLAPQIKPGGRVFYFLARNRLLPAFILRRHLQKLEKSIAENTEFWEMETRS